MSPLFDESPLNEILTDAELIRLLTQGEVEHLHPGETLFAPGEMGRGFHVLYFGALKVSDRKGGTPFIAGPGDVVGEEGSIEGVSYTRHAVALEPTVLYRIPLHLLRALRKRDESISCRLMRMLARVISHRMDSSISDTVVGEHVLREHARISVGATLQPSFSPSGDKACEGEKTRVYREASLGI